MAKMSDGFDYPVGQRDSYGRITATEARDGDGYYNAQNFGVPNSKFGGKLHLAEDWNGDGGKSTDKGYPIYAVSNGTVRVVDDTDIKDDWGKVVIIDHALSSGEYGGTVASMYAHLDSIDPSITEGFDVDRGQVIGTLGVGARTYRRPCSLSSPDPARTS